MPETAARAPCHEIGADAGCHLVTLDVEMAGHRTRRGKAREGQVGALHQFEFGGDGAGAFNGCAADFAIALRRMGVADAEQPAFDFNGQDKVRFPPRCRGYPYCRPCGAAEQPNAGPARRVPGRWCRKKASTERARPGHKAPAPATASYFQMCRAGSLNWSASRPNPGIFAVQPQPEGPNSRSVTLMASPGSAPSM